MMAPPEGIVSEWVYFPSAEGIWRRIIDKADFRINGGVTIWDHVAQAQRSR